MAGITTDTIIGYNSISARLFPTETVIEGNYIGINAAGTSYLIDPELVSAFAVDGGGDGIQDFANATTIENNLISQTPAVGTPSALDLIGTDALVEGNTIYGNPGDGIDADGTGDLISGNSIYDNAGIGVQIGGVNERIGRQLHLWEREPGNQLRD